MKNKRMWFLLFVLLFAVIAVFWIRQGREKEKKPEDTVLDTPKESEEKASPDGLTEEFHFEEKMAEEDLSWQNREILNLEGHLCIWEPFRTDEGGSGNGYRLTVLGQEVPKWNVHFEAEERISNPFVLNKKWLYLPVYNKDGSNFRILILDSEGKKVKEIPLPSLYFSDEYTDEEGVYFNSPDFSADEEYLYVSKLVSDGEKGKKILDIYRKDGSLLRSDAPVVPGVAYLADGKGNYLEMSDTLVLRKTESGEKVFETEFKRGMLPWADTERKLLYLYNNIENDLDVYQMDEKFSHETVLQFGEDTLFYPEGPVWLRQFVVGEEGIAFKTTTFSKEKLRYTSASFYLYEKVPGGKPTRDNILKVTVPYPTSLLQQAKRDYERIHRDTRVEIDAKYNNGDDFSENYEQYREQLQLRLMNGDVGDVVQTAAVLDYRTVVESDVFLDLAPMMKSSKVRGELYDSVMRQYEKIGLRGIPMEMMVGSVTWNRTKGETIPWEWNADGMKWSDVLQLARTLEKEQSECCVFDEEERDLWFSTLLYANLPDLTDYEKKTVDFHQEWFMTLIRDWKEMRHHPQLFGEVPKRSGRGADMGKVLFTINVPVVSLRKPGYDVGIREQSGRGKSELWNSFSGERSGNRMARAGQVFSISAKSKYPKEAWEFIEILLSASAQSKSRATTINRNTMDREHERVSRGLFSQELSDRIKSQYNHIMDSVEIVYVNEYVELAAERALEEYFEDKLTLEEALTKAENDVRIILNE